MKALQCEGASETMTIRRLWKRLAQRLGRSIQLGLRHWDNLSFRQGHVIANRYRILQNLGMGSYGVAYLCMNTRSNRLYVLKRIHPINGGKIRAKLIYEREISILNRLDHPCIPKLYESFYERGHPCFTMEYMEGDNLDYLLFHKGASFSEKESLLLIKKLLLVVGYVHSLGIVHRDISIANVVLDGDETKLIDWGLARELITGAETIVPDEEEIETDPTEKKLRRRIHVTSDFYAIGHLLLFLLYSTYSEKEQPLPGSDLGWEKELSLHPDTKKLLRRLLMTEQPYHRVQEILGDVDRALHCL